MLVPGQWCLGAGWGWETGLMSVVEERGLTSSSPGLKAL